MTLSDAFKLVLLTSAMGTIVALMIFLIKALFKNKLSPNWHYYIWIVVIIRLLVPYSLNNSYNGFNLFSIPFHNSISVNTIQNKLQLDLGILNNSNGNSNKQEVINKTENISQSPQISNSATNTVPKVNYFNILSIIWVGGIFISILYIFLSYHAFVKRIKLGHVCIDKYLTDILARSKSIIGVSRNVILVYSNVAKSPTLMGVINPKIIVPIETIKDLTMDEKNYVFMHELIHLKRKDILLNWIITLLLCIHWFNPVIWLVFIKLKKDCEVSCDAEILKHINPSEYVKYGETLIKLIKTFNQGNWKPGTTAIINKSEIKRRIIMISNFKKRPLIWSAIAIVLTISTIAICFGRLTNSNGKVPNNKVVESAETKKNPVNIADNSILDKPKENQTTQNTTIPIKEQNSTPTTAPATVIPKAETVPLKGDITYTNSQYNFTLKIPNTWKDKYVISDDIKYLNGINGINNNDIEKAISFLYKVDEQNYCTIFSVVVYKKPVTKDYFDRSTQIYIKTIGVKTFAWSAPTGPYIILVDGKHDSDYKIMKTMLNNDFPKIMKTIKFN